MSNVSPFVLSFYHLFTSPPPCGNHKQKGVGGGEESASLEDQKRAWHSVGIQEVFVGDVAELVGVSACMRHWFTCPVTT